MRARSAFRRTAALATAAATALGCAGVTPVASGPELHRATEIGFIPTEGPPLTRPRQVRFAADRPDVTLLRLEDAGWSGHRAMLGRDIVDEPAYRLVPVCVAPCDADVEPGTWYAVGGNDIARTLAFKMHDDASTVRVRAGGSQTLRELGMGAAMVSVFAIFLGGLGYLGSDPHTDPSGRAIWAGTLAGGVGVLAAGITLWLLNPPTKVAFEQ